MERNRGWQELVGEWKEWQHGDPAAAGRLHAGSTRSRQGEAAVSAAAHGGAAAVGLLP